MATQNSNRTFAIAGKEDPDEKNDFVPKLWDFRNIMFIITVILNFIDLYSDFNAGAQYYNLNYEGCQEHFKCALEFTDSGKGFGIALIVAGVLGFFSAGYAQYREAKELWRIHKNCKSEKQLDIHEAELFKNATKYNIISFVIEDTASIIINFLVALVLGDNDNSISRALRFSCGASIASMLFSLLNSWRKRWKFREYIKCCDTIWLCHCVCWCGCHCIVLGMGFITLLAVLITSNSGFSEPLLHLNTDSSQTCHSVYPDENDYLTDGELLNIPQYVFRNCSGVQYSFEMECNVTGVRNEYVDEDLKCRLLFEYDVTSSSLLYDSECDNHYNSSLDSYCDFTIWMGNCSTFPIVCTNDFLFYRGSAEMFACFDYCVL